MLLRYVTKGYFIHFLFLYMPYPFGDIALHNFLSIVALSSFSLPTPSSSIQARQLRGLAASHYPF